MRRLRFKEMIVLHPLECALNHLVAEIHGPVHARDLAGQVLPNTQMFGPPRHSLSQLNQPRRHSPHRNRALAKVHVAGQVNLHAPRQVEASLYRRGNGRDLRQLHHRRTPPPAASFVPCRNKPTAYTSRPANMVRTCPVSLQHLSCRLQIVRVAARRVVQLKADRARVGVDCAQALQHVFITSQPLELLKKGGLMDKGESPDQAVRLSADCHCSILHS